ncbi:ribosomal protein S18-alanine N-acetyltransferase [Cognatazoarcus halotolerans]|uniref:ribosomal protein S18-alanine N-acetyltransferase n=1 Tax=Cognatazoarcus halotolerans TaxID=2686016 RepID=UPI00135C50BD|nr:ribosomal protein S18-alanine N-acetyltransferase [Cognatazoarcus halotolerans]MBX3679258.1 ribosomal protein S18-alanine N-acetyltransferase [Rhodocyclaceae bacterium]
MTLALLEFEPMSTDDLDWVSVAESTLHSHPWTLGNFADSLGAGYSCWIGRDGTERVSYGVLMLVLDEAHLLNISVTTSAQRRGVGQAMLQHLFNVSVERGASQMFLEVRPSNAAALALYCRNGFEPVGRRKAYYPGLKTREDAIVMRRQL